MTEKNSSKIQGEGDIESAELFNSKQKRFVSSDKGKKLIGNTAELQDSDRRKAEQVEAEAKQRAAEKDPQVTRNYHKAEK